MEALASYSRIVAHPHHHVKTTTIHMDMIGWVQSGTKTLLSPYRRLTCKNRQLFLLTRGSQWDVVNDPAPHQGYRALVIQLEPQITSEFFEKYSANFAAPPIRSAARLPLDTELQQGVQRMVETLEQAQRAFVIQKHRIIEVLLLLAERGCIFPPGNALTWAERIRRLIGQRPHAQWDSSALAQACHVSTSTLRRRLATCGFTVAGLVKDVRLETALTLLQSTALPVGEIAQRCGYASHGRFSRAFQLRYGFLPSHLRSTNLTVPAQILTPTGE